jgi:repressor LexA
MRKLNDRDWQVFNYIVEYKRENDGNSPTIRDICAAVGFSSTSYVNYILEKLEHFEFIMRDKAKSRGISVIGGHWSYIAKKIGDE